MSAANIEKFCDEYEQMRGMDPDLVYGLHMGDERECSVRISELRALVAEVRLLREQIEKSGARA